MYFKNFETLRDSDFPADILIAADALMATFAERADVTLGATLVAREADISLEEAVELLLVAARAEVVSIQYELGCTECGNTHQSADQPTQFPTTEQTCRFCFEDFLPNLDDLWVTFRFREGVIEQTPPSKKKAP